MQRLREMLGHGGIAILALVFALAFAGFYLANALAQVVIFVVQQHVGDPEAGGSGLQFRIVGTDIDYSFVLQSSIATLLVAGALYGAWQLTQSAARTCPECLSAIPREASVCRFCTAELPEDSA